MFGRETFIVRIAEDAMAPRVRAGDYVWIDPDEPAVDGSVVAVRDPGRGGETVVRRLVVRDGRRFLRALDERIPERTVDAGNETDIRGRRGVRGEHRVSAIAGSAGEVFRPVLHQRTPPLEEIAARVGGFGLVPDRMRERRHHDRVRGVGPLGRLRGAFWSSAFLPRHPNPVRKDVTDRCFSSHPGTTNVLGNSHWTNPKKCSSINSLKAVFLGHDVRNPVRHYSCPTRASKVIV